MVKHGTSHGISVLATTILAAFMIEILKPMMPTIWNRIDKVSIRLIDNFLIPVSIEHLSITITASLLAILWGIFFKLRFTDKRT